VVGDGALRGKLELLCAQLEIAWAVHFTGWLCSNELLLLALHCIALHC
jgi:hypothetical protein